MKPVRLTLCLILIVLSSVSWAHSEPGDVYNESWALLVGINRYKSAPAQQQLTTAVNDVTEMQELLIKHFGFKPEHIIMLTDEQATKDKILDAMNQLTDTDKIREDDRVLIHFSGQGQGVKLPSGDEIGFLIVHDAEIDFGDTPNLTQYSRTCLGMEELRTLSRRIPAKHVLFLIDACYGGVAPVLNDPYTGIIIDASELQVRKILYPKISAQGDLIYGDEDANRPAPGTLFWVEWTRKLEDAKVNGRVKGNPLIIRAREFTGDKIVISAEDAAKINTLEKEYHLLEQGRVVIVISDPRPRGDEQVGSLSSNLPNDLRKVANLPMRQAIIAGKTGEKAFEKDGHGIFTYTLLKALESGLADQSPPDNVTTAMELASYLMVTVPADSGDKQHPYVEQIDGEGEFIFLRSSREPAVSRQETTTSQTQVSPAPDRQRPQVFMLQPAQSQITESFTVEFKDNDAMKLVAIAADNVGVISVRVNGRLVPTTAASPEDLAQVGLSRTAVALRFEAVIDRSASQNRKIEIQVSDAAGNAEVVYVQIATPTIEAAPAPQPAVPDGIVLIPAGKFEMGSEDANGDAKPIHTVYLDAFYIDKYEVTNAQFKAFINANPQWRKATIPAQFHNRDYLKLWDGDNYPNGKGNHPVVYVSWYAAAGYANWVGKRLPTEAQWEKAARGSLVGKTYTWGNSLDETLANYNEQVRDTTAVGAYLPNGYDLYDMAGNVWEWCADIYDSKYYAHSPPKNPDNGGLTSGIGDDMTKTRTKRVLRGGSWGYNSYYLGVAIRNFDVPWLTNGHVGFRCVQSVNP